MELFRKLAKSFLFKIVLAFVALSFVLFGVSGFILGSPNSWVAKIGSSKIGFSSFNNALRADRDAIMANNSSAEAQKYLESPQFKSDVLNRMVSKIMIGKLSNDFGVYASKDLILEAVAKDEMFKKEGKFSHEIFEGFLKRNGINEEKYVTAVSNEIVAAMIIQSMSMVSPLDSRMVEVAEKFKQEERLADVVTISLSNVKAANQPTIEEITKFFEANKKNYIESEKRLVSYLTFAKKDFAADLKVSDAEILEEYNSNSKQYENPELRSFYHVLFDKKEKADDFLAKFDEAIKSDKSKSQAEFSKLAKQLLNKEVKAISLNAIAQKALIPQLSETIFKLNLNDRSAVLESPLGYHVFLVRDIKQASPIALAKVREDIRKKLLNGREEKIIQEKIAAIDDVILSSNSLEEVAKKFGFTKPSTVRIDKDGKNENGLEVREIAALSGFSNNAFALSKNQVSKIYPTTNNGFYALRVEEVFAQKEKTLKDVQGQVAVDLLKANRTKEWQELAARIGAEIKANPAGAAEIAAKNNLKFEKNRKFPRIYYLEYQGQKIPYQNQFLNELFAVKIGESTSALPAGPQEFVVGIVRQIKEANVDKSALDKAKGAELERFRGEVMQEFNNYLSKKHPVKINEKIFKNNQEQEE
jgi:peptidyl-prolyl cis-trans isomerase D